MSVKDYSATPGDNTLIGGMDIAEGCPPRNVNNAVRQLMADLADTSAKDPLKARSADANNAIAAGTDGKLHIPSGAAVMLDTGKLLSKDAGNLAALGTDKLIWVNPDIGETIGWDNVTEKPDSFLPSKHAASHAPGGSDPITMTNIPAGIIMWWKGSVASIPTGWALCNGAGGTPDLRDRFVIGAGGAYAVGATGGSRQQNVGGVTSAVSAPPGSHTHTVQAVRGTGSGPVGLLMGPATGTSSNSISTSSPATSTPHSHSFSGSVDINPPYYALAAIMKL